MSGISPLEKKIGVRILMDYEPQQVRCTSENIGHFIPS
jgi:hypothetical protein